MIKFYNAGAGSGKTHKLGELLTDFLKDHQPSEVILTTFSRKAADELKERSRIALLVNGLTDKAAAMGNAVIGTVNAVCSQLVEKYSMEIGISPQLRVLDEVSTKIFFNDFVNRSINKVTSNELGKLCRLLGVFERKDDGNQKDDMKPDWPRMVKDLANRFRAYNFKKEDVDRSKAEVINAARAFLLTREDFSIKNIWRRIENERDIKLQEPFAVKDKDAIDALETLRSSLSHKTLPFSFFAKAGKDIGRVIGQNNPWFKDHVTQCREYHRTIEFRDSYSRFIELLYDTAFLLINEFQTYKHERGLIDFADQELLFLQMLQCNEIIRDEITSTFKMVMVDEFQDSSPVQLAIFHELNKLVPNTIWVGDPKQAIYGFRDSDTELFQQALKQAEDGGNEIIPLPNSYRSRPALVHAANDIFTGIFKGIIKQEHVKLEPSEDAIAREQENEYNAPALAVQFYADANQPNYHRSLALQVSNIIKSRRIIFDKQSKSFRPIRGGDIALIFRINSNVRAVAKAFKERGLEVSSEAEGLQQQAEVLWLTSLLRLLINQHDNLAITNIALLEGAIENVEELIKLRTPFADEEATAFETKTQLPGEKWQSVSPTVQLVVAQQELLAQMPLVQAINHLISVSQLPRYCTRWGNKDQRMANINKVIEQAAAYQEQCEVMGMAASFPGYLNHICEIDTLPPSESADAITLISAHKSKGLEWNLVIPVSLSMGDDDYKVLFNTIHVQHPKENGNNLLGGQTILFLPWPFGSSKVIDAAVPDLSDNRNTLDELLQATNRFYKEEDRLMYVALTRARDYLVIPYYKRESGACIERERSETETGFFTKADWEKLKGSAEGSTVELRAHTVAVSHIAAYEVSEEKMEVKTLQPVYYNTGDKVAEYSPAPRYISPSRLTENAAGVRVNLLADYQQTRLPLNGLQANSEAHLGTTLHNAFATWQYEDPTEQRQASLLSLLHRMEMAKHIKANELDDRFVSFRNYVYNKYAVIGVAKELPLRQVLPGNGAITGGIADMVLQTEAGLVLIDHKTFPGDFESMAMNEEHAHYAGKYCGQLLSYKQMLEASTGLPVVGMLLHYVVQGKVVEVDIN
ncbi:UvrD-helicase domain-containing protein [soil metagenome]